MRILISGGSGYLGSRLCERLGTKHELFATYRSKSPSIANIEWIRDDGDPMSLYRKLPDEIDWVLHLAQSSRYREFPEAANDLFSVNVALTQVLLEYARKANAKNFIYTSTGGVYPRSHGSLKERSALSPGDFYAATKLASEALIRPYADYFAVCILRLFFIYGPGQRNRLIPGLIERIRCGKPIDITHKPDGLRLTPTHVDDVVEIICEAANADWSGTLNVASPEILSVREMAQNIAAQLKLDIQFCEHKGESHGDLIPNLDTLSTLVDMGRFRSFEEGIRATLSSF